MYIFIDESGINKQTDHSSFVLVYLEVKNYSIISDKIEGIENKLGIGHFHWSEVALPVKQKFVEEAIRLDFKVKIAIVKNPVNSAKEMERILPHWRKTIKLLLFLGKQKTPRIRGQTAW